VGPDALLRNEMIPLDTIVGVATGATIGPIGIGAVNMEAFFAPSTFRNLALSTLTIDRMLEEEGVEMVQGIPMTLYPRWFSLPWESTFLAPGAVAEVVAVPFLGYFMSLTLAPVAVSTPNACGGPVAPVNLTTAITLDEPAQTPVTAMSSDTYWCIGSSTLLSIL